MIRTVVVPGEGRVVVALPPREKSEYEQRLERMTPMQLLSELDEVASIIAASPAEGCEQVRLYRRELARRLFASPEAH